MRVSFFHLMTKETLNLFVSSAFYCAFNSIRLNDLVVVWKVSHVFRIYFDTPSKLKTPT